MTLDAIIDHYSVSGYEPFSTRELIQHYGRKWLKDSWQVARFQELFAICRDGIVRPRKLRLIGSGDTVENYALVIDTSVARN